ncbi:MAG: response regulator [Thermodesulfobacteriota bacterium]
MSRTIEVLVVEDNPDDYFLLEELLTGSEEEKFTLHQEERLENAIAFARAQPVDVAVIDLSLPDSSGLDTFREFHRAFPLIPVVIVTGSKDQESALKAVQDGAQDFVYKGEPSTTAIVRTLRYAIERQRLTTELKTALSQVRQLKGLLPICSHCKRIRDDRGYWNQIESYIRDHSEAEFSHSICQECVRKHYPELYDEMVE